MSKSFSFKDINPISFILYNPWAKLLKNILKIEDYKGEVDNIIYEIKSNGTCKITDYTFKKANYSEKVSYSVIPLLNIPEEVNIHGKKCIVTELGDSCFEGLKRLTNIKLPKTITKIGKRCFYNCTSLTSIELPNSVIELGGSCFSNCESLSSILLPKGITKLGYSCFERCISLVNITLPNTITELGDYCFSNCTSLTIIDLSEKITKLGNYSFQNCKALTSIHIPDSIKVFGKNSFSECSSLTNIILPNSLEKWDLEQAFGKYYPRKKEFNEALGATLARVCMSDGELQKSERNAVLKYIEDLYGTANAIAIKNSFNSNLDISLDKDPKYITNIQTIAEHLKYQELLAFCEMMFEIAKIANGILQKEWEVLQDILFSIHLRYNDISYLNMKYAVDFDQEKEGEEEEEQQHSQPKIRSEFDAYYKALGLNPTNDKDTIRKAYHTLARKYHPDTVQDPAFKVVMTEKFKVISEAYNKLVNSI